MDRMAVKDLYWAAGFLEGEGSFTTAGHRHAQTECVTASQVHKPPLDLLLAMFGGTIRKEKQPIYKWFITGERARGIMLTLYPLLSPKRQTQIKCALLRGPVLHGPQ